MVRASRRPSSASSLSGCTDSHGCGDGATFRATMPARPLRSSTRSSGSGAPAPEPARKDPRPWRRVFKGHGAAPGSRLLRLTVRRAARRQLLRLGLLHGHVTGSPFTFKSSRYAPP